MANKPIFSRRLNKIEVAIWNNETKDSVWQNINFQRTYRDEKGETQNAINSFRMEDLPAIAFLAAKAYDFLASIDD